MQSVVFVAFVGRGGGLGSYVHLRVLCFKNIQTELFEKRNYSSEIAIYVKREYGRCLKKEMNINKQLQLISNHIE